MSWLWDVLAHNLPPNNWRSAIDQNNWIASSHTIIDKNNKMVRQQVISNGFKGVQKNLSEIVNSNSPQSNIKLLFN